MITVNDCSAQTILASTSPFAGASVAYTMRLSYPMILDREVGTHRLLRPLLIGGGFEEWGPPVASNAASSRAMSLRRMIADANWLPRPEHLRQDEPGKMGSMDPLSEEQVEEVCALLQAHRAETKRLVERLADRGLNRQHAARYLAPFMRQHRIVTFTSPGVQTFLNQRLSPRAQPEIQDLAEAIRQELAATVPGVRDTHTPFAGDAPPEEAARLSAARCARVSYGRHGAWNRERDLDLYDHLVANGHWSPLEHVLCANAAGSGVFTGWVSLRATVEPR